MSHHEIVVDFGWNRRIEGLLLATHLLDRFVLLRVQQVGVGRFLLFVAFICEGAWATLTHLNSLITFRLLQVSRGLFGDREFSAALPGWSIDRLVDI